LTNFLVGLSSFYLDYAKDSLYCDKADSEKRKGIQYVLYKLTYELCLLYNPILCFTMDEVYSYIPGHKKASPQLEDMPKESHEYGEDVLKEYEAFKSYRDQVLKALEEARAKGLIGASSEAELHLSFKEDGLRKLVMAMGEKEAADLFLVSSLHFEETKEDKVVVEKAKGELCERCRNFRDDVKETSLGHLCARCQEAVEK
jgi:isoleucyl-tRNA synthetase